jgi:ribonuclease VapC
VRAVIDASALIAFVDMEAGGDLVAASLGEGLISAVNYAEVVAKFVSRGAAAERVDGTLRTLGLDVVLFNEELAVATGALIALTKEHGLSLGDRACLALAQREGLPALTADRSWGGLNIGIEVRLIR